MGICLTACLSVRASAQYGGGGTGGTPTTGGSTTGVYTAPSGGYSSAKTAGIAAGAAAAGAVVVYLVLRHRHSAVTGCVRSTDNGLALLNEKNGQTYSLVPGGTDLQPGERLELKGKRSKNKAGAQNFQATKVVKNLGACAPGSAQPPSQ